LGGLFHGWRWRGGRRLGGLSRGCRRRDGRGARPCGVVTANGPVNEFHEERADGAVGQLVRVRVVLVNPVLGPQEVVSACQQAKEIEDEDVGVTG